MTNPKLKLRPATLDDAGLLLMWRNDPATRSASRDSEEISNDEHLAWLVKTFQNIHRQLWVAEEDGVPVGTARTDLENGVYELSWTVAPQARGRGVAKRMIAELAGQIRAPLRAVIKSENRASVRIAESVGLELVAEVDGFLHFRRAAAE